MIRLAMALTAMLFVAGCAGSRASNSTGATTPAAASVAPATPVAAVAPAPAGKVHKLASGLVYEDLVIGNGRMADPGLQVSMNYTGWLMDGTEFDSSARHGRPYTFSLGTGAVIAGWDQGIKGMRLGGKRKLTIPPDLGYGAQGSGDRIPPNSTLVFEVELVGIN